MTYTIIGFDPSLRNWGYCIAKYDSSKRTLEFADTGVIHSKPTQHDRKNLEDLQSATQLYHGLQELVQWHAPDYFVAELPVGSQSSRAMVSYATCISLCAALAHGDGINTTPLLAVTPQAIKKVVSGTNEASKQQVINWVKEHYADTYQSITDYPKSKQEHICDAIVAVHCAILTKSTENITL